MATQLLLIAAFVTVMILMSANYRKRKKWVMFIGGSSIESALVPGNYISQLLELLKKENVDDKYELLTRAIESESINEVFEKIEVSVLDKGPDVVIINFTVEDMALWLPSDQRKFRDFFNSVFKRFDEAGISIIVCLPLYFEYPPLLEKGQDIAPYILSINDIATKRNIPIINLQQLQSVQITTEVLVDQLFAKEVWQKLKSI